MAEGQSVWKQSFFDEAAEIIVTDPLSYFCGLYEKYNLSSFDDHNFEENSFIFDSVEEKPIEIVHPAIVVRLQND